MATATPTTRSFNPGIDGLLGDYQWSRGVPLDYGFPTMGAWGGYTTGEEPYVGYLPITATQQALVLRIFAQIESFTNLDFFAYAGPPEQATLRFGRTETTDGAHAYLPFDHPAAGDVWFAVGDTYANPSTGDYAGSTHLHEIGHALGLKHPHDDETFGVMPLQYDNMNYTVMTYRSYEGMAVEAPFHNAEFGFNQTYMMYDIAALQYLYGADFGPEARNGNTFYAWNPNNGNMTIDGVIEIEPGANIIFQTVWDGGGIDTYDFSAFGDPLIVDLRPGEWSTTKFAQLADLGDGHRAMGNIANALLYQGDERSLIENAVGGAGNDRLLGNQAANTLTGNGGSDIIDGGAGADVMIGGSGDDFYTVENSGDSIVEAIGGDHDYDRVDVSAATYVLGDYVEVMTGTSTAGGQNLTGNGSDNVIRANDMGNVLAGAGGNDFVTGGNGADTIGGGAGDDIISALDQADQLDGGSGNDRISAGAGDDRLLGDEGQDSLFGDHGVDTIDGGSHDDLIHGGELGDTLLGGAGNDTLYADRDTPWDPIAGGYRTYATGDELGIDTLIGGAGADLIEGGAGSDRFTYLSFSDSVAASQDRIRKFESGPDKIDLSALPSGSLSWTELTDPSDNSLYSLVSFAAQGNTLTFRVDGKVVLADFILPVSPEIQGTEGNDQLNGSDLHDEIFGNGGNDLLRGFADDDLLDGGAGNDRIEGGLGADEMFGGTGDDVFTVDHAGDTVGESAGGGNDMVESAIDYTLGAELETLVLTGSAAISGTGNGLANAIYGNGGANTLSGLGGDDWLDGGLGADSMSGGLGNDLLFVDNAGDQAIEIAGQGDDEVRTTLASYSLANNVERLTGLSGGNQTLIGNGLANIVMAGVGDDTLDGGAGADQLWGGIGSDNYFVDNVGDTIVEAPAAGIDTVHSAVGWVLADPLEHLTLIGGASVNGTGNGQNNILTGNSGNNILDGAFGDDLMFGGLGNDTYIVDALGDGVNEQSGAGTDTVRSAVSYTLGEWVENLELLDGALTGTGNGLANSIAGNGANNTLNGMGGADTMAGGAGHDTYHVDNAGDVVTEVLNGGNDTVLASTTVTLADNVEYLTLTGTGSISGTGNGLNNIINGNNSANFIVGGLGADFMTGNGGDDTYFVDNGSDKVFEGAGGGTDTVSSSVNWTLGAEVERLVLTGTAEIQGIGNGLANFITGNAAANVLNGGIGADTMQGGLGNDTFIVDDAGDVATDTGGVDVVQSSVSYTLHASIDNLILTGAAAINGTGNGLWNVMTGNGAANTLDGGLGNDVLNGGLGADTMIGGAGHDTYHVDNVGDVVTDTGGGNDHVHSSITYTLGSTIEYLTLTGSAAINGTGNGLNNLIYGNAGNNVIDGGLGADFMVGGNGNDIYYVENGSDQITEHLNQGTDTVMSSVHHALRGNIENLTLIGANAVSATGNELNNVITGNSANNVLSGGLGADALSGGGGNDTYQYRFVTESTAASKDQISGFNAGDRINLSILDANTGTTANNDAFTFIGANAFSNTAGELRAAESGGIWTIEADVNGDGLADLVIGLTTDGGHIIGAGDFIL